MSKSEPHIEKFMTREPRTIEDRSTIAEAQALMKKLGIRHLPVMSSGKIIGVLSDRDIRTARAMPGADLDKTLVRYFCHENPYVVEPDDSLHDVAGEMALRHYGCAIIARNGKLVGIFTTVDACRTIAILLEQGL